MYLPLPEAEPIIIEEDTRLVFLCVPLMRYRVSLACESADLVAIYFVALLTISPIMSLTTRSRAS